MYSLKSTSSGIRKFVIIPVTPCREYRTIDSYIVETTTTTATTVGKIKMTLPNP